MPPSRKRQAGAARTQSLFRNVNDRIRQLVVAEPAEFLCECLDESCVETIPMTIAEYDRIRLYPTHFIVLPGHLDQEVERVAVDEGAYQVVEKLGEAGLVAESLAGEGRP